MDALDPRGRVRPSMGGARGLGDARDALTRVRCRHQRALGRQHRRHHGVRGPLWRTMPTGTNWLRYRASPQNFKKGSSPRDASPQTPSAGRRPSHPAASARPRGTRGRSGRLELQRRPSSSASGVCARQRRPPNTALTGALQPARFSWNRERAREVGAMSTPARKRLMRDFKRLQKDPPAGISGTPTEANIMVRAHTRLHRVGLTRQISPSAPPLQTRHVSTPSRAALPHSSPA